MTPVERLAAEIRKHLSKVWPATGSEFSGPLAAGLAADLIAAGWTYVPPPPALEDWPEMQAHLAALRERLRDHEAHHRETIYGRLEVALQERDHARDIAVALEQELASAERVIAATYADYPQRWVMGLDPEQPCPNCGDIAEMVRVTDVAVEYTCATCEDFSIPIAMPVQA